MYRGRTFDVRKSGKIAKDDSQSARQARLVIGALLGSDCRRIVKTFRDGRVSLGD